MYCLMCYNKGKVCFLPILSSLITKNKMFFILTYACYKGLSLFYSNQFYNGCFWILPQNLLSLASEPIDGDRSRLDHT